MATRYRQLQAPEQIRTGIVDDTGARYAQQLSATFKDFERTGTEMLGAFMAQEGAREGAAAGAAGKPDMRQGFRALTRYGEAYNNAATRSYAIKLEGDIEDTAARLETEAGNDPVRFEATFGKVHEQMRKDALPGSEEVLDDVFLRRLAAGKARLGAARAAEIHKDNVATTAEGVSRATDRIAKLRASDLEVDQLQAEIEEEKLRLLIDGAERDGTLTPTEAKVARTMSNRDITRRTVVERFRKELESPYGNPTNFIMRLRAANQTSEALTDEEEQQLEADLFAELREMNALRADAEAAAEAARRTRLEQGDRDATSLMLAGRLTKGTLLDMVRNDELDPAVARTLNNEISEGAGGPMTDPAELAWARINVLSMTEDEIMHNTALSWKDRADLVLERRDQANGWRGTQRAREADARIERALGINPGVDRGRLSDAEREQLELAKTEFYSRIESLPPDERDDKVFDIADQVIQSQIKNTSKVRLRKLEQRKQDFIAQHDLADMDAEQKKQYDRTIADFDRRIAAEKAK